MQRAAKQCNNKEWYKFNKLSIIMLLRLPVLAIHISDIIRSTVLLCN